MEPTVVQAVLHVCWSSQPAPCMNLTDSLGLPPAFGYQLSCKGMHAGKAYGERPPLVIAAHVYPELAAWLDTWRAVFKPTHDYVFTQTNGSPLTGQGLYKLFYTSAYRITGNLLPTAVPVTLIVNNQPWMSSLVTSQAGVCFHI